jgi:S1-C subfamily serine protease
MKRLSRLLIIFFIFFSVQRSGLAEENFTKPINKILPSLVEIGSSVAVLFPIPHTEDISGTGILISKDGFILTNAHMVVNKTLGLKSKRIEVSIGNRKYIPAQIVGVDIGHELALIKVDLSDSLEKNVPVRFAEEKDATLGSKVLKAGFPGTVVSNNPTFGHGVITNTRAFIGDYYAPLKTTDTQLSGGDSGGPIFDLRGKVIGMDVALKGSVGYFIPLATIRRILPRLYKGDVPTSWLGFQVTDCLDMKNLNRDSNLQKQIEGYLKEQNVKVPVSEKGTMIMNVPEADAGDSNLIKMGDLILSVDGRVPQDRRELIEFISEVEPGKETKLMIIRDQTSILVRARVGEFNRQTHLGQE